jgi:lysophospholipase L1-like esterase
MDRPDRTSHGQEAHIRRQRFWWVAYSLAILGLPKAASAQPIAILPLGDSITDGFSIPGGYRTALYAQLTAAGRSVQYIGSATNNPSPTLSAASQVSHEGHSGYTIAQITTNLLGSDGTAGNNGGHWLDGTGTGRNPVFPDVVLLHIGTNDIHQGLSAGMVTRLNSLLDTLASARPTTHVFVASIVPIHGIPAENALVLSYNQQIHDSVVPSQVAQGHLVQFVDQYANFVDPSGNVRSNLYADSLHPNQSGYDLMGATWANAIQAVPEPSAFLLALFGAIMVPRFARPGKARSATGHTPSPAGANQSPP